MDSFMPALLASLFGLAVFAILTQRTLVGMLVGMQAFFLALVLAIVLMVPGQADPGQVAQARSIGLVVMVFCQLQALAGVGLAVRLHYLKTRPEMSELRRMRH